MNITFCKQLMNTFSASELEELVEYSSGIWANKRGEANVLLISAEDFMAEVCLSLNYSRISQKERPLLC